MCGERVNRGGPHLLLSVIPRPSNIFITLHSHTKTGTEGLQTEKRGEGGEKKSFDRTRGYCNFVCIHKRDSIRRETVATLSSNRPTLFSLMSCYKEEVWPRAPLDPFRLFIVLLSNHESCYRVELFIWEGTVDSTILRSIRLHKTCRSADFFLKGGFWWNKGWRGKKDRNDLPTPSRKDG